MLIGSLLLTLALAAAPAAEPRTAPAPATATDAAAFRADALSLEAVVDARYAYLDRFPGGRMPMTDKLRAEAAAVTDGRSLLHYAERALLMLADHHAITGSSFSNSWAIVPSYADLWIERRDGRFVIEQVRDGSPAAASGMKAGDELRAVDGVPVARAVAAFWADLGAPPGFGDADFAARILAAGRRDRPRQLMIARKGTARAVILPSLYQVATADRPSIIASREGRDLVIRFNDSLGENETIAAFDAAMAKAKAGQRVVIDLTDTPSGGNTTIARAVLGWFVDRPRGYQVHNLPSELRQTGIARQWIEEVLPRLGKHHRGPIVARVGRWTGSMGEGVAIGFHAIGAPVVGTRMAGLRGAVEDERLEHSGLVIKLPTERLTTVDGIPREAFVPDRPH